MLAQTNELETSVGAGLLAEKYPAATLEEPNRRVPETNIPSQPEPYHYPALLAQVFDALVDPDGYDAGLRRLDESAKARPKPIRTFLH